VGAEKNPWTILLSIANLWDKIWANDILNAKRERSNLTVNDTPRLKNMASSVRNQLWIKIIRSVLPEHTNSAKQCTVRNSSGQNDPIMVLYHIWNTPNTANQLYTINLCTSFALTCS
jgi:hypothetical protein